MVFENNFQIVIVVVVHILTSRSLETFVRRPYTKDRNFYATPKVQKLVCNTIEICQNIHVYEHVNILLQYYRGDNNAKSKVLLVQIS